jgi:hypothetical protein
VPALTALSRAVEDKIRDGLALLTPRDEARDRKIPYHLPKPERPHLAQPDRFSHRIWLRCFIASKRIASGNAQTLGFVRK